MKHATYPSICEDCQSRIETLALTGITPIMTICAHAADAGDVIVVFAHAMNSRIGQWDVHGPMSHARGQSLLDHARKEQARIAAGG